MKVSLIQAALIWENHAANRTHLEGLIQHINDSTDLIILSEMFTTGFTMKPKQFAEAIENNATLDWLKKIASQKNCAITGSAPIEENGNYFNRLFFVKANGEVNTYDKRHLFRMGNEHTHYTAGEKRLVVTLNDWKICPQICYDLRFPVWSRNRFQINSETKAVTAEYDILLYVANWPEVRRYPWRQLLIARAIENQCYVIGVNRVGEDGNGIAHSGDSLVINPRGEIIHELPLHTEHSLTATLDMNYLQDFRNAFPVGMDADGGLDNFY
jgi:omega-amidase